MITIIVIQVGMLTITIIKKQRGYWMEGITTTTTIIIILKINQLVLVHRRWGYSIRLKRTKTKRTITTITIKTIWMCSY